ncbi:hypothetical protein EHS25_000521 [Saitozyma podzolica]|uniref:DUF1275 domain protein n=1 Tax=Saitozyma podzolica TaxID=1890683 RepID=A0A427YWU7_9TREE|nr:hypothetical protein EHS25_000521 [Saitozyma podzolica]
MQRESLSKEAASPADAPVPLRAGRTGYWTSNLDLTWQTYLPVLLVLSFAAGCIDVFSVPALRVFTGNLVYAALGVAQMVSVDPSVIYPVSAIVALAGSWVGSFTSGLIGNHLGRKRRGFIFGDLVFQSVLIFLCSYSMGAQNVTVKGMGTPPTIPTQVATGAMAELVSDPRLFVGFTKNRPRNERIIFVLTFFLGGVIGGLAYRYSSPELCLLLTAIFKLLAAISVLLVPRKDVAPAPEIA